MGHGFVLLALYSVLMAAHVRANGTVFMVERKRGPVWYAKYRVSDPSSPSGVRQIQKMLGPAWTKRSHPPAGFLNRKAARATLDAILTDARRGAMKALRTGVTFEDAANEWLRHGEHERDLKPSTLRDYRSAVQRHLIPAFGSMGLEEVSTAAIERWLTDYIRAQRKIRQARKLLAILHGIFERAGRVWPLSANPARDVEKPRVRYDRTNFDFFSPEEVWSLARAAGDLQDQSIFLTAAFAGLRRGECIALRWRDIDFPRESVRVQRSVSGTEITAPKSGHGRVVPLAADLATVLAQLSHRERFNGPDDLVFCSIAGGVIDGSALRRRYKQALKAAGLRDLRFHDLRHTFGSLAIQYASIVQVQAWLGHADVKTTARYLHYKSQTGEADLLGRAFAAERQLA